MKKQKGFLTLITIVLIVIFGAIGVAVTYMFVGSATGALNFHLGSQAFYLAEAGLEAGTRALETPLLSGSATRVACGSISGTASLTNASLGNGTYTITASGPFYATPSTVNGALTNNATTIPVISTTNYQSSGRIMIDTELINYTSINATNFLNVTRGVDGTTAAAHVTGTPIGQYQCTLTSAGGLPSVASPNQKRTLQQNVQLQEGWAVGNFTLTNDYFARWSSSTNPLLWTNATVADLIAFNINGISMISYVDGWAVGASANFYRWNGSSWSRVATGLFGTYQSVFCNATNDCHAVANGRRFGHWNGTSWSSLTASGSLAATNLLSVSCDSTSDCWAVGSGTGGGRFYHWNGSWTGIDVSGVFSAGSFPFNSVFCNSSSDCWVVGNGNTFGHYNGTTWSTVTTASLPSVQYNDVICNSGTDCWAVGNLSGSTDVIAHYTGSWANSSITPVTARNLLGIACANTKDCWAVGSTSSSGILHYDGTSWTAFTTSLTSGIQLNAISLVHPNSQPQSNWAESFP